MQPPKHTRSCNSVQVLYRRGFESVMPGDEGGEELRHRRAGQLNAVCFCASGRVERAAVSGRSYGKGCERFTHSSCRRVPQEVSLWLASGQDSWTESSGGPSSPPSHSWVSAEGRGRASKRDVHDRGHFFVAPWPLEVFTSCWRDRTQVQDEVLRRRRVATSTHTRTPPLKRLRRASRVPTAPASDWRLTHDTQVPIFIGDMTAANTENLSLRTRHRKMARRCKSDGNLAAAADSQRRLIA